MRKKTKNIKLKLKIPANQPTVSDCHIFGMDHPIFVDRTGKISFLVCSGPVSLDVTLTPRTARTLALNLIDAAAKSDSVVAENMKPEL